MNKLFVIPTPIGNLDDFTLRAISELKRIKFLLCEDTKVSGKIKKHLDLDTKMISLHKFNEKSRVQEVLKLLEDGDVALISDAGTPTISDPGQLLISEIKDKVCVVPLPGANAITTSLSASGLVFDSFSFVGFFDKEENKIVKKIKDNLNSDIIVSYESPNRINKTLSVIYKNFGDITVVVAREITKMYEEIIKDKVSNLLERSFKGEIVLLIDTSKIEKKLPFVKHIEVLKEAGMDDKSIINYLTKTLGYKKNDIYNFLKK